LLCTLQIVWGKSSLKSFFVNPGNHQQVKDEIIADINKAKERILVATGFANDNEIINAIRSNTRVKEKRVLLNIVDIESAIKRNLAKGWGKPVTQKWLEEKLYVVAIGDSANLNHMHHKFIIIDNQLWFGSFNLTYGAINRNWESLLRFPNNKKYSDLIKNFEREFYRMFRLGIFSNENQKAYISEMSCNICNKKMDDSNYHFRFSETNYTEMTVGYDYYNNIPKEKFLNSSTHYLVECINSIKSSYSPISITCDICGEVCKPYDITKTKIDTGYTNDGSVEFSEGYDPLLHTDNVKTLFKCPKCFVKGTYRSLYIDFWDPDKPIPDYI